MVISAILPRVPRPDQPKSNHPKRLVLGTNNSKNRRQFWQRQFAMAERAGFEPALEVTPY